MRLFTFRSPHGPALGLEHAGRLVDLARFGAATRLDLPPTLLDLIRGGPAARRRVAEAVAAGHPDQLSNFSMPLAEAELLAPLRPGKILCSGINYHSHLRENPAARLPAEPFFFAKLPSTVIGPGEPIQLPARSRQVDYEVEFAVVIGRSLRRAAPSALADAIFGYTALHDVSARDVQMKDNQITLGKNFDTFCPLGPCVVTTDEIPDPRRVRLRSRVNGELRQEGCNEDWVFGLDRLLADLSGVMTLEPGDVVSTGTPAGVGLFRQPPVWLQPGDVVEVEVDGIGILRNPVVASP